MNNEGDFTNRAKSRDEGKVAPVVQAEIALIYSEQQEERKMIDQILFYNKITLC